jgi:hypothetical protein
MNPNIRHILTSNLKLIALISCEIEDMRSEADIRARIEEERVKMLSAAAV